MTNSNRSLAAIAGVTCIACCAGPIVAALAAIGAFTTAGVAFFGLSGLAGILLAIPVYRRLRCRPQTPNGPVAVASPATRRTSAPAASPTNK